MKKILALLPVIAAFALAGCGDKEKEGSSGEKLPYTKEEAQEKMEDLKKGGGFEIAFKVSGESAGGNEITLGTKGDFTWVYVGSDKAMVEQKGEGKVQLYSYDATEEKFAKSGEPISSEYDYSSRMYETYYGILFSTYDEIEYYSFSQKKNTTYLGRSAIEYKVADVSTAGTLQGKIIIDKETCVTLFWEYSGQASTGESASAKYEVTLFKTGDQVSVPAIKTEA